MVQVRTSLCEVGEKRFLPQFRVFFPFADNAKTFAKFVPCSARPSPSLTLNLSSYIMKTLLHLCVVLAVCQVALAAQLPYGNPVNPSPFVGQPGPQASNPFSEQDRRLPQQNIPPAYQDPRGRTAQPPSNYEPQPQQQQQNQYQQMMQQQQQQRPLGVYSSPVYLPFGMLPRLLLNCFGYG